MNSNVEKVLNVIEDNKKKMKDNEYKLAVESLMAINKTILVLKMNSEQEGLNDFDETRNIRVSQCLSRNDRIVKLSKRMDELEGLKEKQKFLAVYGKDT